MLNTAVYHTSSCSTHQRISYHFMLNISAVHLPVHAQHISRMWYQFVFSTLADVHCAERVCHISYHFILIISAVYYTISCPTYQQHFMLVMTTSSWMTEINKAVDKLVCSRTTQWRHIGVEVKCRTFLSLALCEYMCLASSSVHFTTTKEPSGSIVCESEWAAELVWKWYWRDRCRLFWAVDFHLCSDCQPKVSCFPSD
jgi:hypothetical protein